MKIVVGILIGLSSGLLFAQERDLLREERYAVSYMKSCMRGTLQARGDQFTDVIFPDFEDKSKTYFMPLAIVEMHVATPSIHATFKDYKTKFDQFSADKISEPLRNALRDVDVEAINKASQELLEHNKRESEAIKQAAAKTAEQMRGAKGAQGTQRDSCAIL